MGLPGTRRPGTCWSAQFLPSAPLPGPTGRPWQEQGPEAIELPGAGGQVQGSWAQVGPSWASHLGRLGEVI